MKAEGAEVYSKEAPIILYLGLPLYSILGTHYILTWTPIVYMLGSHCTLSWAPIVPYTGHPLYCTLGSNYTLPWPYIILYLSHILYFILGIHYILSWAHIIFYLGNPLYSIYHPIKINYFFTSHIFVYVLQTVSFLQPFLPGTRMHFPASQCLLHASRISSLLTWSF